jgi:hypothetical protein
MCAGGWVIDFASRSELELELELERSIILYNGRRAHANQPNQRDQDLTNVMLVYSSIILA